MKRASFAKQKSPIILSVIKERTPAAAIAVIKNATLEGAEGFDLHLSTLDPEYINVESLSKIISATKKPVLALHYNGDYFNKRLGLSDEERMRQLTIAAEAGAAAVDMQGYTFEKDMATALEGGTQSFVASKPREVTLRQETIEKQRAFIDKIHALGAEVVLSTHTGVMMTAEQMVELAKTLEARGADVVKIIEKATCVDDIPECFRTVIALKKVMNVPFACHLEGKLGKVTRIVAPMLGSYMVFCFDRYTESSNFEQCHLKSMADAFRLLEWQIEE